MTKKLMYPDESECHSCKKQLVSLLSNQLIVLSMIHFVLVYKMSESAEKMTSSNILFCPQPKYIKFTVINEERMKVKSDKCDALFLKKYSKR